LPAQAQTWPARPVRIIAPAVYPKLPCDPVKDFAPIANVAQTPQTLITSPKSGVGSVKELIEKARAGDLDFGPSGNGSAAHLAVEPMLFAIGIRMRHVPFKGNADAQMALQSGDIQLMADAIPSDRRPDPCRPAKASASTPASFPARSSAGARSSRPPV
jgi:tripartite-type tricarboxylate transporter receptor subunit TctC